MAKAGVAESTEGRDDTTGSTGRPAMPGISDPGTLPSGLWPASFLEMLNQVPQADWLQQ